MSVVAPARVPRAPISVQRSPSLTVMGPTKRAPGGGSSFSTRTPAAGALTGGTAD
jgi:hypothetical protein